MLRAATASKAAGTSDAAFLAEAAYYGYAFDPGDVSALYEIRVECLRKEHSRYGERSAGAIEIIATRFERSARARELHEFFTDLIG